LRAAGSGQGGGAPACGFKRSGRFFKRRCHSCGHLIEPGTKRLVPAARR